MNGGATPNGLSSEPDTILDYWSVCLAFHLLFYFPLIASIFVIPFLSLGNDWMSPCYFGNYDTSLRINTH